MAFDKVASGKDRLTLVTSDTTHETKQALEGAKQNPSVEGIMSALAVHCPSKELLETLMSDVQAQISGFPSAQVAVWRAPGNMGVCCFEGTHILVVLQGIH